jgi:ABC-type uncharacterized transport system permease subunit
MTSYAAALAELSRHLRTLPRQNPRYASDALMIGADALEQAAQAYRLTSPDMNSVEVSLSAAIAIELQNRANQMRALAPIFAPPVDAPGNLRFVVPATERQAR